MKLSMTREDAQMERFLSRFNGESYEGRRQTMIQGNHNSEYVTVVKRKWIVWRPVNDVKRRLFASHKGHC
jgi:hypothetical protein